MCYKKALFLELIHAVFLIMRVFGVFRTKRIRTLFPVDRFFAGWHIQNIKPLLTHYKDSF